jgi:copper resistance protein D
VTQPLVLDPLILARSIHFAATALASGTVCFMVLVVEPPALRRRLVVMVWIALAVAMLSGIGWLVLLATEIFGAPILEVCLHGGAWSVLTETRFGMVWCARGALALLLSLLMLWPAARWLALIAAALLMSLLALIGHAGATSGTTGRIHLVSDIMHLLSASAWLGGLPAFALLLAHARQGRARAKRALVIGATRRFSLLGIVSVAVLLASGAINSWNLLAGPRDLLTTDYGRLVLLKIILFAAMVCIAAVNRYHLTPQLPAPAALRALQRNSLYEIGLGLCVIVFVGALGTLAPTAHIHTPPAQIPPEAAFIHIHTAEAMADVTIDPGRTGQSKVTVRVSRENFTEFPAKEVRLALDPPGGKDEEQAALRLPDGTWVIEGLEIRQPGIWTARVVVTSESGKPIMLDAPIMIDR